LVQRPSTMSRYCGRILVSSLSKSVLSFSMISNKSWPLCLPNNPQLIQTRISQFLQ
jgi:hypothetical protein